MLGGLARWLRAAGYDAGWYADVADWDLVRLARRERRLLLSADTGIFRLGVVRDGDVPALHVPAGLTTPEQLAFVFARLGLRRYEPRCMACGGGLGEIPREQARSRVPPRSFAWAEHFHQCERCGRLFWRGSHWRHIESVLRHLDRD